MTVRCHIARLHAAACAVAVAMCCASTARGQSSAITPAAAITQLADFDAAKRSTAARALRRMPDSEAASALLDAIGKHRDEYARYRAFVLLVGFNDPRIAAVARSVLTDKNDRLREAAYWWLEHHPDAALTDRLLQALETEQGEFVRPAMLRALAALDANERVRVALTREVSRGLDIYRSAVIEALGDRRAAYAVDAIATSAHQDGPLQDDAVLALGKIGGPKAEQVLASIETKIPVLKQQLATALCLARADCSSQRIQLGHDLSVALTSPRAAAVSSAGLALLASRGDTAAFSMLYASTTTRELRTIASVGLASAALKSPNGLVSWLLARSAAAREPVMTVLQEGFDRLEADLDEENFYASIRGAYWKASEGSDTREVTAALIDKLGF